MFYILYNESNNKIMITQNEDKMFDLLVGDCVMIGNVKNKKSIEKKVFEFWHSEMIENNIKGEYYEYA